MAGNRFDFELDARDNASATIQDLEKTVAKMLPLLDKAGKKAQLGGKQSKDSVDDLNARLEKTSQLAKSSVQYFGDMVPPLRLVSELSGKYGGAIAKIGMGGAVAYGAGQAIASVAGSMKDAAEDAYHLSVQAKDAGMSVHDLTQVAGSMRILGADTDKARASVESLSRTLTDSMNDRNSTVTGVLNQIGVSIVKKDDHTADTMATLEKLAEVFPTIGAQKQRTVADALGLTPEMLALMREGVRYKELLVKSDKLGLTVPDDTVQKLGGLNDALNEISASWEGLKNRTKNGLADKLMSDLSIGGHKILKSGVKDGLDGVADLFQNGDFTGLSHALGFISTADADKLRRIQGDKDLYNSLPRRERGAVDAGFMTDAVRKRYDEHYRATDEARQLQGDMAIVTRPEAGGNHDVSYHQGDKYDTILNEAGEKYGVDPRLLKAVMTQESHGDPSAVSSSDARGLMQVIPSNFKATGITDWKDPRQNIMAGAQILAENLRKSGGDVSLALRYYNGGYDTRRWGKQNQAYPGAVLGYYQQIVNAEENRQTGAGGAAATVTPPGRINTPDTSSRVTSAGRMTASDASATVTPPGRIITPDASAELVKSLKAVLEQTGKGEKTQVEILLTGGDGQQKRIQVPFGGRVTTSMTTF